MEYTEINDNGRIRLRRGQISDFNNLPNGIKENFIKIKQLISRHFNKEMEVRVIGSYLEGYYDEFSNYNVVIDELPDNVVVDEEMSLIELENEISAELGIGVNVIFHTFKYSPSIIQ